MTTGIKNSFLVQYPTFGLRYEKLVPKVFKDTGNITGLIRWDAYSLQRNRR